MKPSIEDVAVMREQGDLKDYLLSLAGLPLAKPKPAITEPAAPTYHIPRKGAWPCGSAATGPTPPPCNSCQEGRAP